MQAAVQGVKEAAKKDYEATNKKFEAQNIQMKLLTEKMTRTEEDLKL